MSSNTAERLGVYGYLMKHPHSHPPINILTSTRVQWRRKRKVGHVCRFNEPPPPKKALYDKLMFAPPAELYSLQTTNSILLTYRRNAALLRPTRPISFNCKTWWILWILNSGMKAREMSPIYCVSQQSCLIVFRM